MLDHHHSRYTSSDISIDEVGPCTNGHLISITSNDMSLIVDTQF